MTLGLMFNMPVLGRLTLDSDRQCSPSQQMEYCNRNSEHMLVEVEQIPRVPSVVRGQRAEWILPVRRTWQGLREDLARETEAKDESGDLNNSMGEKLQLTGHICTHGLQQASLVFASVNKTNSAFQRLLGRDCKHI